MDSAGRTSGFAGNLGDATQRTYSSDMLYSSFGAMTKEKFGTDTAIYNKLFYNVQGQLAEIRESTGYTGPTDTTWDRGAIINHYSNQSGCWGATCNATDNNGNLRRQEVYIPRPSSTDYDNFGQSYDYDSLNRLQSVSEKLNGGATQWQQEYVYDRFGNRKLHQTNTWGTGINKKDFTVTANNRLGVPTGQSGTMTYDAAGNLTTDTYSAAAVTRVYDAENRMASETQANSYLAGSYTYNADGQRVRRTIGGQPSAVTTWQVYGFGGELLAEYPASAAATSPQKEYGYRNGQLLITAEGAPAATNVALAANGASASASSAYSGFAASGAINGDRKGLNVSNDGYWSTASSGFPASLEVAFNGSKTISEIDVFTVQNNYASPIEPTTGTTFTLYGLSGYEVQYWSGSAWVAITNGSVTSNNKVWRKFSFTSITTTKIRVLSNASADGYSRLTELEAWTGPSEPPPPPANYALESNGATVTASSSYSAGYPASGAINGNRSGGNWTNGGGWNDAAPGNSFPDWLQVDFNGSHEVGEIDVFTLQDNWGSPAEPTETMTFSQWGLTGYVVEYWDGSAWAAVPGGNISGNNKVWRKISFSPITTTKIRVVTNASVDGYSRITEVEAWSPNESSGSSGANINWLVSDQLGTPRMIFDQTGTLANVKRHDYLPFGEELSAGTGGRTTTMGYSADAVRQKFTQKERDNETGLDFFGARYYTSTQGRFTGADPLFIEMKRLTHPQAWNLYSYTRNNPLKYVDDDGMEVRVDCGASDGKNFKQCVEQTTTDLNNRKGSQFKTEIKDGKLGVVGKVDVSTLSKSEAALYNAITDTKNVATLTMQMPGIASTDIMFDQYNGRGSNTVDRADLNQLNKLDKSLGGEVIAHAAMEAYVGVAEGLGTYKEAHARANEFFGDVKVGGIEGLPAGAAMATSGRAVYDFRRVGTKATVEKTFITPQPAQSLPNNWERTRGNIRVIVPSQEKKK